MSALSQQLGASLRVNSAGYDDWGCCPETSARALEALRWLYRKYFRVRVHGIENVPAGRVMLVANHGGQLPLDGMFIAGALAYDADPPRLVRGMAERWFPSLPFVSALFYRTGQVVGDPRNCRQLLENEQCVMVFPEGVRGSGKPYRKRYQLQRFGTGFLRLAAGTRAPIVPVAVIGSEETYPALASLDGLARLLGAPYFPVTPFFPLLGPLGMIPLPVRIDLHFGAPLRFDLAEDAPDEPVEEAVGAVMGRLEALIAAGLRARPDLRWIARSLAGQGR